MPPQRFTAVYHAGWQGTKVRLLQAFALACLAGAAYAGVQLWAPRPPEPLFERRFWAIGGPVLGLAFAGGMGYYGRVYVARVTYEAAGNRFLIRTLGPPGRSFVVPAEAPGGAAYHEGRLNTYRHRVNAPWYTLRVPGGPALLLDAQGDVQDEALWRRLTREA